MQSAVVSVRSFSSARVKRSLVSSHVLGGFVGRRWWRVWRPQGGDREWGGGASARGGEGAFEVCSSLPFLPGALADHSLPGKERQYLAQSRVHTFATEARTPTHPPGSIFLNIENLCQEANFDAPLLLLRNWRLPKPRERRTTLQRVFSWKEPESNWGLIISPCSTPAARWIRFVTDTSLVEELSLQASSLQASNPEPRCLNSAGASDRATQAPRAVDASLDFFFHDQLSFLRPCPPFLLSTTNPLRSAS